MKTETIEAKLLVMGEPRPLIHDYLDSTNTPSINGYFEYKYQESDSEKAQVRWDSQNQKNPTLPNSPLDESTISGLMANLKK